MVSACDNGVLYDADKFLELVNDDENDIIVWSYRNNYASFYNPNAYSWLDVDEEDNIIHVGVKEFTDACSVKDSKNGTQRLQKENNQIQGG